jgi:hypothetical protein
MPVDVAYRGSVAAKGIGMGLAGALSVMVTLATASVADPVDLPLEAAVKASYIYRFAPFVQWPESAFEGPNDPLTICLVGHDPFGRILDDAVRGQRINGRPISVRRISEIKPEPTCHILFAGGGENSEEMLQMVANQPVLTVTDQTSGMTGGIVQFVTVGDRLRFTIDQAAAQQHGIAISSKLLGLAVNVAR